MLNNILDTSIKKNLDTVDEINFRTLLYDLADNKWILIYSIIIVVFLALIFVILSPPQYKASALIQVATNKNSESTFSSIIQKIGLGDISDAGKDSDIVQTALLQSRFILDPAINQLGLNIKSRPYRNPFLNFFSPDFTDELKINTFIVPNYLKNKELLLITLPKNSYKLLDKDNNILLTGKIGELSENKLLGIKLKVEILSAPPLKKFGITRYSNEEIYEHLLTKLHITDMGSRIEKNNLNTGILEVSLVDTNPQRAVTILNTIVMVAAEKNIKQKSLEAAQTISFLKSQISLIKSSLSTAENRLNLYQAQTGKIDIKSQAQAQLLQLTDIDKRIESIRLSMLVLAKKFTDQHPYMIELKQKLEGLYKDKRDLEDSLRKLPSSDQTAINLMRDVKVKNSLYLILLNKLQELEVTKSGTVSDVIMLSSAEIPDAPLSKNVPFVVLVSALLGFIIGFLIVIIRKAILHRIASPDWIEENTHIQNVAIVPYSKQQAANSVNTKSSDKMDSIPILAQIDPEDIAIEALRSLRTNLQVQLCTTTNNIVSILGLSPQTGKSFATVNLAYLLADTGKKILLLDCDIRRGSLQKYFNIKRAPGLVEYINGLTSLEKTIKETGKSNLDFIPSGAIPPNPSELLMSQRFVDLLSLLSKEYDIVLIDTPPILAVTDGAIVSSHSSINFLVTGSNCHDAKEILIGIKRFTSLGVKLNGFIFNHLKPEVTVMGSYRYKYQYTYTNSKVNVS